MKILFLNSAPIIKYGLMVGFQKIGWETDILNFPSETTLEGFSRKVDEFKPDYVLMEGGINQDPWVFPVVKEKGLSLIYWGIEDPVWMDGLSKVWGEVASLVITPCIESVDIYRSRGIKSICVPFAIDPDFHKFTPDASRRYPTAMFIGNNYNYYDTRHEAYKSVISPFIDRKIDFEVYGGNQWIDPNYNFNIPLDNYKGYMAMESTIAAYSNTDIIIGIHSVVSSKTMQSMRTFEVLGCRGFMLSSYALGVESMFTNHKHLVYSRSYDETIELIDYYIDKPDARHEIALEGQKFVYGCHTYEERARSIADALADGCQA